MRVARMMSQIVRKVKDAVTPMAARYFSPSYSHEGEDMVLRRLFDAKRDGFYVDVGACHPFQFSTTCFFYKNGWRGINIDAMPGSMALFNRHRTDDINLEYVVSDINNEVSYVSFNGVQALNSCCGDMIERYKALGYKINDVKTMRPVTLKDILDKYVPRGRAIDFLNVDVEGMELNVLRSNDWRKYRPAVVLAEDLNATTVSRACESPITHFMSAKEYTLQCKCSSTLIFRDNLQAR